MSKEKKTEYNYFYKKEYRYIFECGLCGHMELDEIAMISHIMARHNATEQKIEEACY